MQRDVSYGVTMPVDEKLSLNVEYLNALSVIVYSLLLCKVCLCVSFSARVHAFNAYYVFEPLHGRKCEWQ